MPATFIANGRFGDERPRKPHPAGITLIELLVALALTIIVIGATFMIYQTNSRFYYQQQSRLEQAQNLRTALYILSREIRMAGDGLIVMGVPKVQAYVPQPTGSGGEWFRYVVDSSGTQASTTGLRTIFGIDNDNGPDTLTLFRTEVESSLAFGQLSSPYTATSSKLNFSDSIPANAVARNDVLGVVNNRNAILLQALTVSDSGDPGEITLGPRFKPGGSLPSGMTFPSGTYVYNLRKAYLTTYWVDQINHNLMARFHHLGDLDYDNATESSIIISPDIEDLQMRYVMNGQNPGEGVDELTLEQQLGPPDPTGPGVALELPLRDQRRAQAGNPFQPRARGLC